MGTITIDTTKWLKPVIIILVVAVLFFVGYKLFKSKGYSLDFESQRKLILVEESNRVLQDSIVGIRKYNDSIKKVNNKKYRNYKQWKTDSDNFKALKQKYNEARSNNDNLSPNEHVRILSDWLN